MNFYFPSVSELSTGIVKKHLLRFLQVLKL